MKPKQIYISHINRTMKAVEFKWILQLKAHPHGFNGMGDATLLK